MKGASLASENFRVVKDFPCGDGGMLKRNSEIIIIGPANHPDLEGSEAADAIVKFGLIEKQDGRVVHLPSKPVEQGRLESGRRIIVVPTDFDTYLERIF